MIGKDVRIKMQNTYNFLFTQRTPWILFPFYVLFMLAVAIILIAIVVIMATVDTQLYGGAISAQTYTWVYNGIILWEGKPVFVLLSVLSTLVQLFIAWTFISAICEVVEEYYLYTKDTL